MFWTPKNILYAGFLTAITIIFVMFNTVIHELGHFVVLKLLGAEVYSFIVGKGDVILSFTWLDTQFSLHEHFYGHGGANSYNPGTMPQPFFRWVFVTSIAGILTTLNALAFVIWLWVRFSGYKVGALYFYLILYKNLFKAFLYLLYPVGFFKNMRTWVEDLQQRKRPSFRIFIVKTGRFWVFIPFLLFFWEIFIEFSSNIPAVSGNSFSDSAWAFASILSIFIEQVGPFRGWMLGLLRTSVFIFDIVFDVWFFYFIIAVIYGFIKYKPLNEV